MPDLPNQIDEVKLSKTDGLFTSYVLGISKGGVVTFWIQNISKSNNIVAHADNTDQPQVVIRPGAYAVVQGDYVRVNIADDADPEATFRYGYFSS